MTSAQVSRRSAASKDAILAAARALVLERGLHALTIEGIAARAGVGKQTIYRWWPSKLAVAVDAFQSDVSPRLDFPDTGKLVDDMAVVLRQTAALLADPRFGPHAAAFLTETTHDPAAAATFQQAVFGPTRGRYLERIAAARADGSLTIDARDDEILDMAFGPLWFRLLTRPETLTAEFGETVARTVLG